MTKGRDLLVSVSLDGNTFTNIAASRECQFQIDQSLTEVLPTLAARAKEYTAGKYGWKVTTSGLCVTMSQTNNYVDLLIVGARVFLKFYDVNGGIERGGYAYIDSVTSSGSYNGLATYNMSFCGSGPLG